MDNVTQPYMPDLEWERFQAGYKIISLNPFEGMQPGSRVIELWRDEAYKIQGKLTGEVMGPYRPHHSGIPGDLIPPITITGTDSPRTGNFSLNEELEAVGPYNDYELPDCHITDWTEHWITGEFGGTFTQELSPWRVRRMPHLRSSPVRLTEWYLNGSRDDRVYSRSMARELRTQYTRRVLNFAEGDYPVMSPRSGNHSGCATIRYGDRQVLLYAVPKECGPSWSRNVAIEYRCDWGGIPGEAEREAIREVLSFIIGRRLLCVGFTAFDAQGWPVEEESLNPWGDNVVAICARPDAPPVNVLRFFGGRETIEELAGRLIPAYLLLREELNLRDAIWRYWLAREASVGTDLPLLSAAVDGMANAWLRSRKSKTRGEFMPSKQFNRLVGAEIRAISAKLDGAGIQDAGRIVNTIKDAYRIRGVWPRVNKLFEEIQLPIGPIEDEAINARHSMAHGASSDSDEDVQRLIEARNAYLTLFDRIMLKVLGYQGNYIDRSTRGYPQRPINCPMGQDASQMSVERVYKDGVTQFAPRHETRLPAPKVMPVEHVLVDEVWHIIPRSDD